jgi:2-polyprenyl-3-methyl-5-hydroxy-6-metoxy-1,4-benzoquinol methylase
MPELNFVGASELELFKNAVQWKKYFSTKISPYISGHVLEVGAGRGDNLDFLSQAKGIVQWTCLEPDPNLAQYILERAGTDIRQKTNIKVGTLRDLNPEEKFDTLIYIDVLEHIENDKLELVTAAQHLNEGGKLIILSPAHPFLFSNFDKAVGHFRRYTRQSLKAVGPENLKLTKIFYLDSVGLCASLANRLLLKQSQPTHEQIKFWNNILIPLSRFFDQILKFSLGKSVIGIWTKGSTL